MQKRHPQSCSHTKIDHNPWWEVDLQRKMFVTAVRVWNRRDCCSEKLNGFEVVHQFLNNRKFVPIKEHQFWSLIEFRVSHTKQ